MPDFGLGDEQQLIRQTARELLARECPRSLVREVEASRRDYLPELYRRVADLGWLGLLVPAAYGGSGADWASAAVLYEELGRALLPGPHWSSGVLGAQLLLAFGTEEQRRQLLPHVASGETILAVALAEPDAADPGALSTIATPAGAPDAYRLDGVKLFVQAGHYADALVVLARLGDAGGEDALGLFLVERTRPGVRAEPMETLGGERLAEVRLDGVAATGADRLGGPRSAAEVDAVVDRCRLLVAAEMVGGAQAALELAVDYARLRTAFGHPIGSFQALQHKMADMALAIEGARALTTYAAWQTDQQRPAGAERAMALFEAGAAYRFVTAEATQVFGGYGVMADADVGLYFRRAKALQLLASPADVLRERMLEPLEV